MKALLLLISLTFSSQLIASPVLVDTNWLEKNISNKNLVVIDTSDHTQHLRFHIPGAVHIDYSEITYKPKRSKVSIQVPNEYFVKLLGQRGISNDKHIIIYDDMGGLNAGRLFWQLEQIGHKKISVLNGGLVKWILEGRKITNRETKSKPATYAANTSGQVDNLATLDTVSNTKALLIDARSKEEYMGYPRYPRSGHIPGATLWDWQNNVNFEDAFKIKTPELIQTEQKKINLKDKEQSVIVYCRSGHRAAQTYLTLRSMGFNKVKLYDGSMAEYSLNKKAPLEKGCKRC